MEKPSAMRPPGSAPVTTVTERRLPRTGDRVWVTPGLEGRVAEGEYEVIEP